MQPYNDALLPGGCMVWFNFRKRNNKAASEPHDAELATWSPRRRAREILARWRLIDGELVRHFEVICLEADSFAANERFNAVAEPA